jgi:hypothetical protein
MKDSISVSSNDEENNPIYYIHFEITDDPCNLIGSKPQCDLIKKKKKKKKNFFV